MKFCSLPVLVAALVWTTACSDDGVPIDDAHGTHGTHGTSGGDTATAPASDTYTTTGGETRGGSATSDEPDVTGPPTTTDPEDGAATDGWSTEDTGGGDTNGSDDDPIDEDTTGTSGEDTTGGGSSGEATTDATGCTDDDECALTEYCVFPDGECGKGAPGTCETIPDVLCPAIYDPVCGCDGVTYGNACVASLAGVDVAYEDECS